MKTKRDFKKPSASSNRILTFNSPVSTTISELLELRAAATALQRQVRRKSAAPQSGGTVSRRLGRGLDFAEVREYQSGDDVRMIDWKVTARSGTAHTKLFVEERERPVLLMVDVRHSMQFATQGMYKSMLAARLAALLGWCAVASHDRVGGFVFSNDWHSEIRPQTGRKGLLSVFRAIQQAQELPAQPSGGQLLKTLRRLRHGVHGGSTVVILSDFHGFDEQARKTLGSALSAMDIVAVHIADRLDFSLPPVGNYPVSSHAGSAPERLQLSVGGQSDRERYANEFREHQQTLRNLFVQQRHTYVVAKTDDPILDVASRVLSRENQSGTEQLMS